MSEKQTVTFGDICCEVKLTTKDPIADGYERYIGLEHLDSGSLKIKRWGMIAEDNPSFTRVFKKGHILFGKRRPYLKKAAIAEFDGICSGDIIVLCPKGNLLLDDLFPFIVQSDLIWDHSIKTSSGSLSPRTKFKSLAPLELNLPLIDKQKKLLEIFDKISELEFHIERADLSSQSINNILGDKLLVEQGKLKIWPTVKAGDVCELITKGASPRWQGFEYVEDGALFVTSENVLHKSIDVSSPKFIPHEFSEKNLKRSQLVKGDVLVNIVGASIGRCALWDGRYEKANVNQAVALLRPSSRLDSRWLLAQLYSTSGQVYFGLSKVDNARPNLSLKSLSDFEFYLPPLNIQTQIMDTLDSIPKSELHYKKIAIKEILNALINTME